MKNLFRQSLLLLSFISLVASVHAQTIKPSSTLSQITQWQTDQLNKLDPYDPAWENNKKEVRDQARAKAADSLKSIDPAKIKSEEALDWARIFTFAGQPDHAIQIIERRLAEKVDDGERLRLLIAELDAYATKGDVEGVIANLSRLSFSDPDGAVEFMESFHMDIAAKFEKPNPNGMLRLIESVHGILPPKGFFTGNSRIGFDQWMMNIDLCQFRCLIAVDRVNDAAIFAREKLKSNPEYKHSPLPYDLRQWEIINDPAPALPVQRSHGQFPGLEKLRGKVVILDFFAHWCEPCKAGLPELIDVYNACKGKGLEVFNVTQFYGRFGSETNLSKDVEFEKMKSTIAEHKIPWPMLYVDQADFLNYGAGAIPYLVVIDKKGIVRHLEIGFTRGKTRKLQEEIEKLLAQ